MNAATEDEQGWEESLLARLRGLPPEVLDLAMEPFGVPSGGFGGMAIELPDDWTPESSPSLEQVRLAARAGLGVMPGSYFDLDWLGSDIQYVTALWLAPSPELTGHIENVVQATSLRFLVTPDGERPVDISHLSQLRTLITEGHAFLSGLGVPRLERFRYSGEDLRSGVRTGSTLMAAVLDVARFDASVLQESRGLRSLMIEGARFVDLRSVVELRSLESLTLRRCARVTGLGALAELPALAELQIALVSKIDEVDRLLDLKLQSFLAWDTPGLDQDLIDAAEKLGLAPTWSVKPAAKPDELVRIARTWDGEEFEVTFDEWGHFAASMPSEGDHDLPSTEEVEQWLRRAVNVRASRALRQAVLFDSEAGAINARVPDRRSATRVRDIWLQELNDPDGLQRMRRQP